MLKPEDFPTLDPTKLDPPLKITVIRSVNELQFLRNYFAHVADFGFDVETNVTDDINDRYIRTIQVGDRDEQYLIDMVAFAQCAAINSGTPGSWAKKAQRNPELREAVYGPLINVFKPVMESNKWLKIGHHLQFEYENFKLSLGIRPWHFWDIYLAEKVILCGKVKPKTEGYFALDDIARKYLHVNIDKTLQTSFNDFDLELTDAQIRYAVLDVRLPIAVKGGQTKLLERDELMPTVIVEFNAIPAFGDMKVNGFYCHKPYWMNTYAKNMTKLAEAIEELDMVFIPVVGEAKLPDVDLVTLEKAWRDETDKTKRAEYRQRYMKARGLLSTMKEAMEDYQGKAAINYASQQQLLPALKKMEFKDLKNTKDETLEKLAGHPAIDALRKYRELSKATGTYGENFLKKYISPISGRIHSSIDQIGADTGRSSSSKPNTQNIPSEDDFRGCFIAQPGWKINTTDISGCELCIAADDSDEPVLIEAFNKGWDVHSLAAEFMYPEKWLAGTEPGCLFYLDGKKLKCTCKVHAKIRKPVKNINYGAIYGLSEMGYARDAKKNRLEARKDLTHWKQWVAKLWKHLEKLGHDVKWTNESRTKLGRRRLYDQPNPERATKRFKNREGRDPTDREVSRELAQMWGEMEREARNTPMQGGNADLIKMALGCGFDSNGKPFLWHLLEPRFGALLVNMVHDEVVTENSESVAEQVADTVENAILRAGAEIYKKVPMVCETNIENCWKK
jgi:DNA polymerase I-like protein with 3'-5' exonuclease and polymerase domains